MKKAITLILTLSLMLSTVVTGCSSSGTNSAANATSSTAGGERTVMTLSCLNGGNNQKYADLMLKQIEQFNRTNKYNVEIKQEAYSNDQYKTKITTLMASNAQPDIFMTFESGWLKPFVDGGKVYAIGDKYSADSEWNNRFSDKSVFEPLTFNNKIYAMPGIKQITVFAYNKALFDKAGAKVPTNYDEFIKACDQLKKSNITPFVVPCKEAWYAGQFLQQLTNGVGGKTLFTDISGGKAKWDDSRFVEAGNELSDMVKKGYLPSGFLGMGPDEAFTMFNNEKVGMMYIITSALNQINDPAKPAYKNIGFFRMPGKSADNASTNVGSIGQSYAISAKAKNIDAAVEFVKSLSTPEFQQALAYNMGQVIVTNTKIDSSKEDPLKVKLNPLFAEVKTYTPWFDRVFGAGEGGEFNNAAVSIMGGTSADDAMKGLAQFAKDNANR